jgi:type I restriction enzyme M protein
MGQMIDRTHREFTYEDIVEICKAYHSWRGEEKDGVYKDVAGFSKSVSRDEIEINDYVLTPGRYVGATDLEDDGILFEKKMGKLTERLYKQMQESNQLDEMIIDNLERLGYGQ